MEPVTIELDESPLFFIPGLFHLSIENPGPIEFDPALLSEEQRLWVNNAHRSRKIKVNNPNAPGTITQSPAKVPAAGQTAIMHPDRDAEIERVKVLLKTPLAALIKSLEGSSNIQLLRMIKVEEDKRSKPRASLLKVVNTELERLSNIVSSKIGSEDVGDKLNPIRVGPINPNIVSEVTEEAGRQIFIRPATKEDFSEDVVTEE